MEKKKFVKIVISLVIILFKMIVCLCIYFKKPHYFKPIENWYIKLHHVYFNDFGMPFKNICH